MREQIQTLFGFTVDLCKQFQHCITDNQRQLTAKINGLLGSGLKISLLATLLNDPSGTLANFKSIIKAGFGCTELNSLRPLGDKLFSICFFETADSSQTAQETV